MAKNSWIKGVLLGILVAVGGWSFFQLTLTLVRMLFEKFGIFNPIWQYLSIIFVVIVLLKVGWHTGLKGALKKLVN